MSDSHMWSMVSGETGVGKVLTARFEPRGRNFGAAARAAARVFAVSGPSALRFRVCASITAISALVSAGFSAAGLIGPSGSDTFAQYAASRSIALLIAALICVALKSRKGLAALALVMILVQGLDGFIGAFAHDPAKTYGPFVFALANAAALAWLLRAPDVSDAAQDSP
jgi:hypothetical protein